MSEPSVESAQRELQQLYKRLELARPMSRERIALQMQIARARRRVGQLERKHAASQPPAS